MAGSSTALVVKIAANLDSLKAALKEGDGHIKAVANSLSKLADSYRGEKIIADANRTVIAIERIGGATKLTRAEQDRVNQVVDQALQKYALLGQQAPAEMQKLYEATKKIPPELKNAGEQTSTFGSLVQKIGPWIAATFSIGAITGFVKSIIGGADSLAKMSLQASMTGEELQVLEADAIASGSSLGSLVGASQNLQQRLGSGDEGLTKAIRTLGLGLNDIENMTAHEQLRTLGNAVGGVQDPTDRATLAADVFGKSWKEILPALVSGMGDVSDAAFVMSNDTVARLDEMGDKWDEFTRDVKARAGTIVGAFPAVMTEWRAFWQGFIKEGGIHGGLAGAMMADRFQRELKAGLAKSLPTVEFKEITSASGLKLWVMETSKDLDSLASSFGSAGRAAKPLEIGTAGVAAAIKDLDAQARQTFEGSVKAAAARQAEAAAKTKAWTDSIADASGKMVFLQKGFNDLPPTITATNTALIDAAREANAWTDALDGVITSHAGILTQLPTVTSQHGALINSVRNALPFWKQHTDAISNVASAFGNLGRVAEMSGHTTIAAVMGIAQTTAAAFAQGGPWAAAMAGAMAIFTALGDKLFKSEGRKVNDLRDVFIAGAGGLAALNQQAHEAGMTLDALLKAKNVRDYEAAVAALTAAFKTQADAAAAAAAKEQAAFDAAAAAAQQAADEWAAAVGRYKSSADLQAVADQAGKVFAYLQQSGLYTADVLQQAWQDWQDALIAAGDETATAAAKARAAADAINDAMGGYQTRAQLQDTARLAGEVFDRMKASGLYTADVMEQAWKAYQDALLASGDAATVAGKAQQDALKKMDDELQSLRDSIKDEAPEAVIGVVEAATRAKIDALQKERDAAAKAIEESGASQTDVLEKTGDDFAVMFNGIEKDGETLMRGTAQDFDVMFRDITDDGTQAALDMARAWKDPPWKDWPAPPNPYGPPPPGGTGGELGSTFGSTFGGSPTRTESTGGPRGSGGVNRTPLQWNVSGRAVARVVIRHTGEILGLEAGIGR